MAGGRLPARVLTALAGLDEALVSSRSGSREVTVPMTVAVTPEGSVYVMTSALSRKAQRWERDPWVRITVPATGESAEGQVVRVPPGGLHGAEEALIIDRFGSAGAATPESLRQTLEIGTHLLLRLET